MRISAFVKGFPPGKRIFPVFPLLFRRPGGARQLLRGNAEEPSQGQELRSAGGRLPLLPLADG